MVGQGKTSLAVALGSYCQYLRKKDDSEVTLLFVCSLEHVRHQVGKLIYNSDISFAIAVRYEKFLRIINNFRFKNEKSPLIILTDYKSALNLLIAKKKEYILFIDEPTVGADT